MADETQQEHQEVAHPATSDDSPSRSATEHTSAPESSDETSLSPSVIYGLLADERRRYVLYYLDAKDGPAEFDALAKHVGAWENGMSIELLTEDVIERASIGLHHTDLPKLAEHGLIEDEFETTVTLADTSSQVAHYIEFAKQLDADTAPEGCEPAGIRAEAHE